MKKTVGSFTYDTETSVIEGPAAYLASPDYTEVIARIKRGDDPCGAFRFSPDTVTALLVTLQTSYAAWDGMQRIPRGARSVSCFRNKGFKDYITTILDLDGGQ